MKAAIAGLATAFTLLATPTLANTPADQCVWDHFNKTATSLTSGLQKKVPGLQITGMELDYSDGQLKDIVKNCEAKTGAKSDFFKGMKEFHTTINGVTFNFQ